MALFGATAALPCLRAQVVAPGGSPAEQPVITAIQQFWDLSPEEKSRPHAFSIEFNVTYYDPVWKILFVEDAKGEGAYVPSTNLSFPFTAGERIRVTGQFVPPSADVSFEHALIVRSGTGHAEPVSTEGRITEWGPLRNKLVEVEGLVDRFTLMDASHLRITLSSEGQTVIAWVPVGPGARIPELADTLVRVDGVYNPKLGPDLKLSSLEIMVQSLEQVKPLGLLRDDPRFKLPLVSIGSLPRQPSDRVVRVSGHVRAQDAGHFLRIRDTSGQVDVLSGQTRLCAVDEAVEAVGYPIIGGTQWQLGSGLFRPAAGVPSGGPGPGPDETLRLASQVLELAPEVAVQARPVWVTGVVTWCRAGAHNFFIQDSSGGVCVIDNLSNGVVLYPGKNVEVHGATGMGPFAPVINASSYVGVSDLILPVAGPVTLEHALTGVEEARWIEMRGYLNRVRRQGGWCTLELVAATGDFEAVLPDDAGVSALVGSIVRVQGVCTAETDGKRKLTGIKLWVPSSEQVQVEENAPKDPYDVPSRSLASLGQYNAAQAYDRLIRVSGVVLYQSPGHYIIIEDGGPSLLVFSQGTQLLAPGDRIEAVGLLARQGGRVTLREATYRRAGSGEEPREIAIVPADNPATEFDGRLVSLQGTLIDYSETGERYHLTVQSGKVFSDVYLDKAAMGGGPPALAGGSLLALKGVYEVLYDEYGRPSVYQIDLRSPEDIVVLRRPSWFTRGRVLGIAGALGLGIVLFIAWVAALRRRVSEQTGQIREQLKRESQLEAELTRAVKLESLGLLAGGIAHDFNNLLTVVMGNISLACLDARLDAESERTLRDAQKAAVQAKTLTQQLLTFAKGGSPVREAVLLADIVREVAEFTLRGSSVRCTFDVSGSLWPANVDKGQIGQVVQNIVINAAQSMPGGGVIDISLRNEEVGAELSKVLSPGRYLSIAFRDHGSGIAPRDIDRIFDPYFTTKMTGNGLGLATVHSIVKKHLGHISVESALGKGSTFRVWLPAAEDGLAVRRKAAPGEPLAVGEGRERILFMDDEELIRQMGGATLRRMGYDVCVVSHGAEAVREFSDAIRQGRPFTLAILDLTIVGGMGGCQTLEELRRMDTGIKAIVSSGYSNDAVLSNYRAHGFQGIVAKPYEASDLALAIGLVLKGARA